MVSDVGEAVTVGIAVLTMAATVEVGFAVDGTLVGIGVDVDLVAGACGAVHAVRRKKYVIARRSEATTKQSPLKRYILINSAPL